MTINEKVDLIISLPLPVFYFVFVDKKRNQICSFDVHTKFDANTRILLQMNRSKNLFQTNKRRDEFLEDKSLKQICFLSRRKFSLFFFNSTSKLSSSHFPLDNLFHHEEIPMLFIDNFFVLFELKRSIEYFND